MFGTRCAVSVDEDGFFFQTCHFFPAMLPRQARLFGGAPRLRRNCGLSTLTSSSAAVDDPPFCCFDYGHTIRCANCPCPDKEPGGGNAHRRRRIKAPSAKDPRIAEALFILDLTESALGNAEIVKKAMRSAALRYHPDSSQRDLADARKFIRAREAFLLLMEFVVVL